MKINSNEKKALNYVFNLASNACDRGCNDLSSEELELFSDFLVVREDENGKKFKEAVQYDYDIINWIKEKVNKKVKIRTAKNKGSSFEYDCQHSLGVLYPSIYRTSERGFQLQYDLESDEAVFECKRLAGMSWNQAYEFFDKLNSVAPEGKTPYLLFKSNLQPCLVMFYDEGRQSVYVSTFEDHFGVEFKKHPSTRARK